MPATLPSPSAPLPAIAVVGGTGNLGAALARRWAKAGLTVIIGSRDAARARTAADELGAELGRTIESGTNREAAARGSLVVLTVPYAAHAATLTDIREAAAGKLVIDTTVPLMPPKVMRVRLPPAGAAALEAQQLLGDAATVVAAFHNVAAEKLARDVPIDCDVLVFGETKAARAIAVRLAQLAGLRGLHAGSLANAAAAEALTSVLIFINKNYAVDGAGVRITGELRDPAPE